MEKRLEDVIDLAIKREEEAFAFYTGIYNKIEDKEAKETLKFLAEEEKRHKEFLVGYKNGQYGASGLRMSNVVNYKIAEHLEKPDITKDMASKDVYLVAAHRETNSYNFYMALAGEHPEGEIKTMLLRMANEESKHKEKVEYLYSNTAFPQLEGG
ncbi:MAG TPA: ferritin family protein [Syntrophorhabdaceae bacterium]|mgnify:FL=1|nr:ferritin family protein [Syntrophorhabdaceae bacterium]HQM81528.1 ferritin family protein [Syntrophorhabdaceae bacterium]